jgi:hypothetical protein
MTTYYRRRPPRRPELLASLLAAAGIGAVTFYFVRMFLARDAVPGDPAGMADKIGEGRRRTGALPPATEARAPGAESE